MKIVVIGNCQVNVITALLNSYGVDICQCLLVHLMNSEQIKAVFPQLASFDIIITQPLGDKYNELATSHMKEIYSDKIVLIHNLYFDGLHPDYYSVQKIGIPYAETDFGGLSRIMLYSWFYGKTKDDCRQMFSLRWFSKLDYFFAWEKSFNELKRRESYVDVSFCQEVEEYTRERPSFFIFNHPTNYILLEYTKKICRYIGLKRLFLPSDCYADLLLRWEIWSVDPIIAEYHQLPYLSERHFNFGGGRFLSLEQMIDHEYALFEKNKDVLSNNLSDQKVGAILNCWKAQSDSPPAYSELKK